MRFRFVLSTLLTILPLCVQADSFYGDKERGWYWYETLPIPVEPAEEKEIKITTSTSTSSQSASEKVKTYRAELENRLATAWLNPTLQNVRAYQEMQKDMLDRSHQFSGAWVRNVMMNAHLDQSLATPVNQGAIHVKLDLEKQYTRNTIRNLSKEYGLFFFYSSSCIFCHKFAPIVKAFAETHGWKVLAISLDGGSIAEFPDAIPDNGLATKWNIQALPSLYAVNPQTEHVIQVAHGMTSIDEMETRIITLVEKK
jgi:conjugal transfer pilus assembly protein TraF